MEGNSLKFIPKQIEAASALSILNTVYSVFLGLLLSYLFQFSGTPTPQIKITLTAGNWIPVSLLFFYYILDWFSTNISLQFFVRISHIFLMCLTLLIAYLGGMVILAFDVSKPFLYPLFATYAIVVAIYDVMLWQRKRRNPVGSLVICIVAISRLAIGLFMFVPLILTTIFKPAEVASNKNGVIALILVFAVDKFIRFIAYDLVAAEALEEA